MRGVKTEQIERGEGREGCGEDPRHPSTRDTKRGDAGKTGASDANGRGAELHVSCHGPITGRGTLIAGGVVGLYGRTEDVGGWGDRRKANRRGKHRTTRKKTTPT